MEEKNSEFRVVKPNEKTTSNASMLKLWKNKKLGFLKLSRMKYELELSDFYCIKLIELKNNLVNIFNDKYPDNVLSTNSRENIGTFEDVLMQLDPYEAEFLSCDYSSKKTSMDIPPNSKTGYFNRYLILNIFVNGINIRFKANTDGFIDSEQEILKFSDLLEGLYLPFPIELLQSRLHSLTNNKTHSIDLTELDECIEDHIRNKKIVDYLLDGVEHDLVNFSGSSYKNSVARSMLFGDLKQAYYDNKYYNYLGRSKSIIKQ